MPGPVDELFAYGDVFEFADGGARDFGEAARLRSRLYDDIGKRPQGYADSALRYRA